MAKQELMQVLDSLHQSLSEKSPLDEATITKLRSLVDEIQSVLQRNVNSHGNEIKDVENPGEPTLKHKLNEFIADFEVRHPQLTNSLSVIAERLSDMGI